MTNKSSKEELKDVFEKKEYNLYKEKIEGISYEESMKRLDDIINQLQDESVAIEKLKKYYIEGNMLIVHCQTLLEKLEQEVLEIEE